ncbi:MAG TPA: DUF1549 and DUF1553 domain-containing protein [Pirellulales bacterium]
MFIRACSYDHWRRRGFAAALTIAGCLFSAIGLAQETCRPPTPAASGERLDAAELAARIDEILAADWQVSQVSVAPPADDAEFLRRVYLDIAGKIPSVAEAREFLDDTRPDKRRRLTEDLVNRGSFAAHFANVWRDLLLPGANMNLETRGLAGPFETWLRVRFAANVPYDQLVAELITARLAAPAQPNVVGRTVTAPSPGAFFQVNENKPENLAANTSRIFLGMQVQCAQCHDHPFSHWRRREFWALAAFFGNLQSTAPDGQATETPAVVSGTGTLSIKVPETDLVVEARFLDGSPPQLRAGEDPRLALSRWVTSRDNPYFARAAVNRLWDHFLGRGFVDPVDDLDETNPPIYPELFAEMARQFIVRNYDLKYLVRTITLTRAYQLSSRTAAGSQSELDHFARMPLKRMTPEQLYDSLVQATGFRDGNTAQQPQNPFGNDSVRDQFLAKFADQSARRSEAQTSIPQALSLMNGVFTADATNLDRSQIMSAIIELPVLDTAGRIETLCLATLSRRPDADESKLLLDYVQQSADENQALADVFWALLNSAEFIFNH